MSIISRILLALSALFEPPQEPSQVDSLSLRDWADLPVHHPRCE